jgi:class 3 adenylate cyclase
VLAEHQRLLHEAFAAHGGAEVDTQGDAFFYVFPRARDAAAAAADGQRALVSHDWPEGAEFRVRMGVHTGEPVLSDEGRYHGMGVHRTARVIVPTLPRGTRGLCSAPMSRPPNFGPWVR